MCQKNAENNLKALGCSNRDYWAGKTSAFDEIMQFKNIFETYKER